MIIARANTNRIYYILYACSFIFTYFLQLQQTTVIPRGLSSHEWKHILKSIIKPLPNSVVPGLIFEVLLMFLKSKALQFLVTGIFFYISQQVELGSDNFLRATYQRHIGYRQQFLKPFKPLFIVWHWLFPQRATPDQAHIVENNPNVLSTPPDQPIGQPSYEEEPITNNKRILSRWKPYPSEKSFTFFTCVSRAACHIIILPLDVYITRTIVQSYIARGLPVRPGLPSIISPSVNPWSKQPFGQWTHQFGLTIVLDCLICLFTQWGLKI
jgi:hypothetical protein